VKSRGMRRPCFREIIVNRRACPFVVTEVFADRAPMNRGRLLHWAGIAGEKAETTQGESLRRYSVSGLEDLRNRGNASGHCDIEQMTTMAFLIDDSVEVSRSFPSGRSPHDQFALASPRIG